jgi:hypothetical protein
MDKRELMKKYVRPEWRAYRGEPWPRYLRRVWPDLADLFLVRDPAQRASALTDEAEALYFARQTFDICSGVPEWKHVVEAFLKTLDGGDFDD